MQISCVCNSALKWVFLFQNKPKDLDPSYKMDLNLCDCFERENPVLKPKIYNKHTSMCMCTLDVYAFIFMFFKPFLLYTPVTLRQPMWMTITNTAEINWWESTDQFDLWEAVPRQVFTPYDCLLISVAFVVLCRFGCLGGNKCATGNL